MARIFLMVEVLGRVAVSFSTLIMRGLRGPYVGHKSNKKYMSDFGFGSFLKKGS